MNSNHSPLLSSLTRATGAGNWRRRDHTLCVQGLPLMPAYTPTAEIRTATINWSFRGVGPAVRGSEHEDAVKVEVWDVVDVGLQKGGEAAAIAAVVARRSSASACGAISAHAAGAADDAGRGGASAADLAAPSARSVAVAGSGVFHAFGVLDASVVDVYREAHAAIFVLDPFAPSSLAYFAKEMSAAPPTLPLLVLLNFRDLDDNANDEVSAGACVAASADAGGGGAGAFAGETATEDAAAAAAGGGTGDDVPPVASEPPERAFGMADVEAVLDALDAPKADADKVDADAATDVTDDADGGAAERRRAAAATAALPPRERHVFECSMANCFGLKTLHTYLNVPFLKLKADSLRQQVCN